MIKRLNIGKKLILSFTILGVVQNIFIGGLIVGKSKNILMENLNTSSIQTLEQVETGFSNYINGINMQMNMFENNEDIIDIQNPEDRETSITYVQEILDNINHSSSDILDAYYCSEYGDAINVEGVDQQEDYDFKNMEWYINAVKSDGQIVYTEPYYDNDINETVITASKAIFDKENNEFIGVLGIDIKLSTLQEYVSGISILRTGYALFVNDAGELLVDSNKNKFNIKSLADQEFWEKAKVEKNGIYSMDVDGNKLVVVKETNDITGWKIVGIIEKAEISKDLKSIIAVLITISIIGTTLVIICAIIISKKISGPLARLGNFMNEVAKGDFSKRTNIKTGDEVEELSNDINSMIDSVSELMRNMNKALKNVIEASDNISNMSEVTTTSIGEVSSAINEVSTGAVKQTHGVQAANSNIYDLSDKIEEVSKYTDEIIQLSNNADKFSREGLNMIKVLIEKSLKTKENSDFSENIVREMLKRISNINMMSEAIAEITEQTNLLSFNASIEAARAGEMGKGFAIVAEEIRLLAEQSRKSTDDIKSMIDEITEKAQCAEQAMIESKMVIKEQDKAVVQTEEVFNNISKAIKQVYDGVSEVKQVNNHMYKEKDSVIEEMKNVAKISEETAALSEEVTASVEEVNVAMNELVGYSENLKEMGNTLNKEMGKFKLD